TNCIEQYTRQSLEKQEGDDGTAQEQLAAQSRPASSLVQSAATLMGTQKGGDNWGEKHGESGEHAFREGDRKHCWSARHEQREEAVPCDDRSQPITTTHVTVLRRRTAIRLWPGSPTLA